MDVVTILIYVILVIIMYGLGCTLTWEEIYAIMKYKRAFVIGVSSQYGFMPFIGWCLSQMFELNTSTALGLIMLCSAPGGAFSNFFCYHSNGNLGLSIAMTGFSTLAAFGMMPLMLWVWADQVNGFKDPEDIGSFDMDYSGLVITLVICIAPVLLGTYTRSTDWSKSEVKGYCCKKTKKERWQWFGWVSSITGASFIVIALAVGIYRYKENVFKEWRVVIASSLIIPFGSAFGYVISRVCQLAHKEAVTVAWETGLQNLGLTIAIIEISFEDEGTPDKREVLKVPMHAAILYYIEIGILFLIFKLVNQHIMKEETLIYAKADVETD